MFDLKVSSSSVRIAVWLFEPISDVWNRLPDVDGNFFENFADLVKFRGSTSRRGRDQQQPIAKGFPSELAVGVRPREITISAKEVSTPVQVSFFFCSLVSPTKQNKTKRTSYNFHAAVPRRITDIIVCHFTRVFDSLEAYTRTCHYSLSILEYLHFTAVQNGHGHYIFGALLGRLWSSCHSKAGHGWPHSANTQV
jgi:hypothetical protein